MNEFENCLKGFKKQVFEAASLGTTIKFKNKKKLLICGMGGSALPGDFLKSLLHPLKFEIEIVKGYEIPKFVNKDYLCVCISYSGNTEETISCFKKLKKKKIKPLVITSGGELENLSTKAIIVPSGLQPRLATHYLTMPLINVLNNSGIIKYDLMKELKEVDFNYNYKKTAESIAKNLKGKIILSYASSKNHYLSKKWKISFNENSKTPAFFNIFPEWNHNEINSFENSNCEFCALMISDDNDHLRVKKRFKISGELLKKKSVKVLKVPLIGKNRISRLINNSLLADWTSYKLAKLYKQDPLKVPIIEDLKWELKR